MVQKCKHIHSTLENIRQGRINGVTMYMMMDVIQIVLVCQENIKMFNLFGN